MTRRHRPRWRALALFLALVLLAAACANDDDGEEAGGGDEGGGGGDRVVTIFGPEVEQEAQGFTDSINAFAEENDITIEYQGDRSFEEQIGVRVDGGDPPDIAIFPQPGKIRDFQAELVPLPEDIVETISGSFDEYWVELVTIDGDVYGVPNKSDLKSLVWYSPTAFEENGYEVPETQEDMLTLADQMVADGNTPFCIGLGSDAATGWPFTDWMEDYMLRLKGPEVYDQWVSHEIAFDDPDVVEVGEYVIDLWSREGYVFGGLQNVAATPFAEAGLPILEGDCMMHRQANFYAANWPEGTEIGEDGDVNAFYLPTFEDQDFGTVVLGGGTYAAAFDDSEATMEILRFLSSTEYVETRAAQEVGGFLSANREQDTSAYVNEIDQTFAEILTEADPFRFDASDLMPGAVGAGSFWTAAVDITTGASDVPTAFAEVEASWPTD